MAAKQKLVKILNALEVEEKMEMGLCFLCDEFFTPEHAMKHKRIRFKVIEMDDEVDMDLCEKPSTLNCSETQNETPQPTKHEEVQGIDEDYQRSSIVLLQTPSLISTTLNQEISIDSTPLIIESPPEPPKTNHGDSTTRESPLQLQASLTPTCTMKLPWFWVKLLRIADSILDWEKLKHAIFEGLMFNTTPNNNSNATETLTLPPPMPPDEDFQRTKAIVKVFHYYFLIKGYDSNCVWLYYDEMVNWLLRRMWINLLNCVESNLFIYCGCYDLFEDIDYSLQVFDQMLKRLANVWDTIITTKCTNKGMKFVVFYLSKDLNRIPIIILCELSFWTFYTNHFTKGVFQLKPNRKYLESFDDKMGLDLAPFLIKFHYVKMIGKKRRVPFIDYKQIEKAIENFKEGNISSDGGSRCGYKALVTVSISQIMKHYQSTIRCQANNKVLENDGASVIDRIMIPMDAHVRRLHLAAQIFLLQVPWYVEVYMNYALDSFSAWVYESYELIDCGNTNNFLDLNLVFGHTLRKTMMTFSAGNNDVKSFEVSRTLINCVSLVLYEVLLHKKIEFSTHVAQLLVLVLSAPMKKVIGAMFVLLMHIKCYSLRRLELNLKCVKYHEESFNFKIKFEFGNCSNMDSVLKVISISIPENFLNLAYEVSLEVESMHANFSIILNLAFLHIMGWPKFGARMSVVTIVHEQEDHHYHTWFLWKMSKFIHCVNQDVCVNEIFYNDKLFDSEEGSSTSAATPRFSLGYKRKKYVAVLHRKMINRGSVIVTKTMFKWRDFTHKHDTLKFAANIDIVVAILRRKMIERGNVHVLLILIKWKTLPLKHGT